jgi:hypothetical protein
MSKAVFWVALVIIAISACFFAWALVLTYHDQCDKAFRIMIPAFYVLVGGAVVATGDVLVDDFKEWKHGKN